jgi:hypothetical protein
MMLIHEYKEYISWCEAESPTAIRTILWESNASTIAILRQYNGNLEAIPRQYGGNPETV